MFNLEATYPKLTPLLGYQIEGIHKEHYADQREYQHRKEHPRVKRVDIVACCLSRWTRLEPWENEYGDCGENQDNAYETSSKSLPEFRNISHDLATRKVEMLSNGST